MKTKNKNPILYRKPLLLGAVLVVVVAVGFQIFLDVYVYRSLVKDNAGNEAIVTQMIIDAAQNLNKPAPVDAASGKIYVPEARVVLPAYSEPLGQVLYGYQTPAANVSVPVIRLTSSSVVNLAENKLWIAQANTKPWSVLSSSVLFNEVPNLQACVRGVQVFYSPQPTSGSAGYVLKATRQLKDGRVLYAYTETGCHADLSPLVDLVSQAQSY